ncbi:diiron oxygenase [Nocardia sp. NPDC051832]|uniref:AurF N-oxygenase family protein n=1 Tax=Nocardia sp. NPDC051832 TaxID=3155673 RepID=UPI0034369718
MALHASDIDEIAQMLVDSAAQLSFDVHTDIDWDAGFVPGMAFGPEHRSALYGTPIWDALSWEQKVEYSIHQLASMHAIEWWVETLLMQMLIRQVNNADGATPYAWHIYTEIADECRHSTMFGRMVAATGAPTYGPPWWARQAGKLFGAFAPPVIAMALAMFFEEYGDALQREAAADESVQPLVRRVSHIHVIEESRHLKFARAELVERVPRSPFEKALLAVLYGPIAYVVTRFMVSPEVFENSGLDRRAATRAARRNRHWRETQRWAAEQAMRTFAELGIRNRFGDAVCRAAGVL